METRYAGSYIQCDSKSASMGGVTKKPSSPSAKELLGSFTGWSSSGADPSKRAVVAWDHNMATGVMAAFVFSMTDTGVAELVKVSVEMVENREAAKRIASEMADQAARFQPPKGLTSRQIRTATAHEGLLAQARRMLIEKDGIGATMNLPMRGQLDQVFDSAERLRLARLALEYETLINSPELGSARRRMAELHDASETKVKNWMSDAKRAGMWAAPGMGQPGAATQLARATAREATS